MGSKRDARAGSQARGRDGLALIGSLPFAALLLESTGMVVAASAAALDLLKSTQNSVVGKPITRLVASGDRSVIEAILARDSGGSAVVRLGGSGPRAVEMHLARIGRNGAQRIVALLFDVAERSMTEERLRAMQRMEALGSLAFTVAHDFNNVLFVIRNYSDLLLRTLPADHGGQAWLEEIRRASDHGASLTRRLLDFARRRPSDAQPVVIDEEIRGLRPMLSTLLGEAVQLRMRHGAHAHKVLLAPGDLEEVLLNLVANARDAMPEGGTVTIETQLAHIGEVNRRLHPELQPGRHVLLSVSDTGNGIAPEHLPHLFEPFFTTREGGTGLGLANVHGIVRRCGGTVTAYSELQVGTTFKVYLPVAGPEPQAAENPSPRDVAGGNETILVVEDDAGVRAVLRDTLTAAGYRVLEAADGAEAPRVAREEQAPIHLLLCDLVLPRLPGREVARAICAQRGKKMKVIFMSGYPEQAARENNLDLADAPLIVKPCSLAEILATIRSVLDAS